MTHDCEKFEGTTLVREVLFVFRDRWLLRSDLSTKSMLRINFCPWCGEKLFVPEDRTDFSETVLDLKEQKPLNEYGETKEEE